MIRYSYFKIVHRQENINISSIRIETAYEQIHSTLEIQKRLGDTIKSILIIFTDLNISNFIAYMHNTHELVLFLFLMVIVHYYFIFLLIATLFIYLLNIDIKTKIIKQNDAIKNYLYANTYQSYIISNKIEYICRLCL